MTSVNETTKRVFIKKESNSPYVNYLGEMIVDTNMLHILASFDNFECLKELLPIVYNISTVYKATDFKLLVSLLVDYPWPLADRSIITRGTGTLDFTNKGILMLSSSIESGSKYFDYIVPQPDPKYPRENADYVNHFI